MKDKTMEIISIISKSITLVSLIAIAYVVIGG